MANQRCTRFRRFGSSTCRYKLVCTGSLPSAWAPLPLAVDTQFTAARHRLSSGLTPFFGERSLAKAARARAAAIHYSRTGPSSRITQTLRKSSSRRLTTRSLPACHQSATLGAFLLVASHSHCVRLPVPTAGTNAIPSGPTCLGTAHPARSSSTAASSTTTTTSTTSSHVYYLLVHSTPFLSFPGDLPLPVGESPPC